MWDFIESLLSEQEREVAGELIDKIQLIYDKESRMLDVPLDRLPSPMQRVYMLQTDIMELEKHIKSKYLSSKK